MTIRLLTGDCRDVLATLPEASVHCVVTSPPYYGLRDYGTAQWEGGAEGCSHSVPLGNGPKLEPTDGHDVAFRTGAQYTQQRVTGLTCRCGARRIDRQLGLEATPEAYLAAMVEVFRAVRRVLRDDGTLFLNIGDSYSGYHGNKNSVVPTSSTNGWVNGYDENQRATTAGNGYKSKDLLLMPARLALALQADGWWVRSDIIWHKPNPMPESCTDRPTSAHEHVFLLSKRARYYYDADAVREEAEYGASVDRDGASCGPFRPTSGGGFRGGTRAHSYGGSRNLRNVWTIPTAPFSDAHFATFPPALVERCIRAGTSERGCCAACGAPWCRMVERGDLVPTRKQHDKRAYGVVVDEPDANDAGRNRARDGHRANMAFETTTTGWAPSCACEADVVPCTVLDPFVGSGTTALVADRLQRHAIGIDLSIDYAAMAQRRLEDDCPLFTSWAPAEHPVETEIADLFSAAAD